MAAGEFLAGGAGSVPQHPPRGVALHMVRRSQGAVAGGAVRHARREFEEARGERVTEVPRGGTPPHQQLPSSCGHTVHHQGEATASLQCSQVWKLGCLALCGPRLFADPAFA
ncbi:unnamed protein product [Miscanthus lutarioriparius]|uniref:Uncharacterized protein n=1 Tax=Miscanthus lutarioriparius TaxID=422564 RepID=A0A811PZF6_9POAL|nr:unnamed protein product [Miscanthus lutarioriparius]